MKFFDDLKNQEYLLKTLSILNDTDSINYGGCLVACYIMWVKLKRPRNMKIVHLDHSSTDIESNVQYLNGSNDTPTSGAHFAIMFEDRIYDSRGLYISEILSSRLEIPSYKIHSFCKKALRYGSWNCSFERSLIPSICASLNIPTIPHYIWNRYGKSGFSIVGPTR